MLQIPELEILEWQETFLPDVSLSARDRRLAGSLDGIELREMRTGLYVKSSSWVGVIRFEAFTLTIRPKLPNVDIVRMLLVSGGLDRLRRYLATRTYQFSEELSLFDLIALLFADACAVVERQGLLRGYIIEEDDLPVLRGRLRLAEQVRRRYGQINRLECRFDEHHSDIIDNQILATALAWCRRGVQNVLVRRRIQQVADIFDAACNQLSTDWREVRAGMTYDRLNAHYQEAHSLAWTVLEGLGVRDLIAAGNTSGFAFLLDMNPLFEEFVTVLVRTALRENPIVIHAQAKIGGHIWDVGRDRSYARIIPDILVEAPSGKQIAIDAKYKRYDEQKLAQSDIYQISMYAHAFHDAGRTPPGALLLYPAERSSRPHTRLQIRDRHGVTQARLYAQGVDIPRALDGLMGKGSDAEIAILRNLILAVLAD